MDSNNQNFEENNNLLLSETEQEISIKVKTIDSNEYLVLTHKDSSISELKEKIQTISKVPVERQRLIFRGKQLKDTDTVNTYKISNLDVIHLVAKTTFETHTENTTETDNSIGHERQIGRSISSLLNLGRVNNTRGVLDNLNLGELPIGFPSTSRRRRLTRDDVSEYNSIESRETLKQSFSSLYNIMECKNSEINLENLESFNEDAKIECFQFPKRKLTKGQWVDVKDTIDQWLEAQVIDIKENKVYIHYNGWGTRWDEWIDMDSERIMPFRYHTRQTTFSNYNSPFPNVKPDANVSVYNQNDSNNKHQFYDFFNDLNYSFNYCKEIFEKINLNREILKKNLAYEKEPTKDNKNSNLSINSDNLMDICEEATNNISNNNNSSCNSGNKTKNFVKQNSNLITIPDIDIAKENESCLKINNESENKDRDYNNIFPDNSHFSNKTLNKQGRENKIKQREIYLFSKQLSPLLDRLGRVMTDMGFYMYHNLKNNKLEDLDKELFSSENLDEELKRVGNNVNNTSSINIHSSTNNNLFSTNLRSTNLDNLIMETLTEQSNNTVNNTRNQTANNSNIIVGSSSNANLEIENVGLSNTADNQATQTDSNINNNSNNNSDINTNNLNNNNNNNNNITNHSSSVVEHRPRREERNNLGSSRNRNHLPISGSSSRARNNLTQASSKMERLLNNQIPCIDSPLVISSNRQTSSQPLVDVYVHTIITPLSEGRQTENANSQTNTVTNNNNNNSSSSNNNPGESTLFRNQFSNFRANRNISGDNSNNNAPNNNSSQESNETLTNARENSDNSANNNDRNSTVNNINSRNLVNSIFPLISEVIPSLSSLSRSRDFFNSFIETSNPNSENPASNINLNFEPNTNSNNSNNLQTPLFPYIRPPFMGLFVENERGENSVNNNNSTFANNNNFNSDPNNNERQNVVDNNHSINNFSGINHNQETSLGIEATSSDNKNNITNNEINNQNICANIANEESESPNFLGRKRSNPNYLNSNADGVTISSNNNNIRRENENLPAPQQISNDNFSLNENTNIRFSPMIGTEIEMIIEEYTEHEDDDEEESSFSETSNNPQSHINLNTNNENNFNDRR